MVEARLICGDCLDVLPTLGEGVVDSVVTDPPYGLEFMGKDWDRGVPGVRFWEAALRVAKPGAHLVAFGGTRTFHRLTCAIEDAGWEIRDCLMWLYGSGFPKSLDVSKAIDKAAGAERKVVGRAGTIANPTTQAGAPDITAPATDAARQWDGWGTALKPAWEPIILARKPLTGTVAANVQAHGTGAINVDGCRVGTTVLASEKRTSRPGVTGGSGRSMSRMSRPARDDGEARHNPSGRWPANVVLDEAAAKALDEQSGESRSVVRVSEDADAPASTWALGRTGTTPRGHADTGGASRFFYTAKASRADRHSGGEGTNDHPTVKPQDLMSWLVRLVTPPGGVVLDPFMGSGSTIVAAKGLGFRSIGIEIEASYVAIAEKRTAQGVLIGSGDA